MSQCKDKHGRIVTVGSKIRLVELSQRFLESLAADELEEIKSMVGQVFHVSRVDDQRCAWIAKEWYCPVAGHIIAHSLGLAPHEMELVGAAEMELLEAAG